MGDAASGLLTAEQPGYKPGCHAPPDSLWPTPSRPPSRLGCEPYPSLLWSHVTGKQSRIAQSISSELQGRVSKRSNLPTRADCSIPSIRLSSRARSRSRSPVHGPTRDFAGSMNRHMRPQRLLSFLAKVRGKDVSLTCSQHDATGNGGPDTFQVARPSEVTPSQIAGPRCKKAAHSHLAGQPSPASALLPDGNASPWCPDRSSFPTCPPVPTASLTSKGRSGPVCSNLDKCEAMGWGKLKNANSHGELPKAMGWITKSPTSCRYVHMAVHLLGHAEAYCWQGFSPGTERC